MSEENKEHVEVSELTEEEFQQIKAAVESFINDPRHDRYQECQANGEAIKNYVLVQNLDWTAESLHVAYVELTKEGKLFLFEESKLKAESQKVPDSLPPIGRATAADLGVGSLEQKRAKKTVEGVAPSSNRDAFVRAAQKFQSRQIPGGRLRLG